MAGIAARSDTGSDHGSRLSASFVSMSGFDQMLHSLTIEDEEDRGLGSSGGSMQGVDVGPRNRYTHWGVYV